MAGAKQLPPVPVPASVAEADSRLGELRALRAVIAAHIDNENTLARDLAALSRQIREISKEIEELEAVEAVENSGVSVNDDDGSDDAPFTGV